MTIERLKCLYFIFKRGYFNEFYKIGETKVQLILLFLYNFPYTYFKQRA